jgi:hypothetical protein
VNTVDHVDVGGSGRSSTAPGPVRLDAVLGRDGGECHVARFFARHGAARIAVIGVCALAVIGLVGGIVRQSAGVNSTAADLVTLEGDGAETLHPMVTLLADLVQAQSNAVRGEPVDESVLNKALNQVSGASGGYAETLHTQQALGDLGTQIRSALARKETGRAAFDTYSGLVTLAAAMMRNTADSSHLIHDPELDSYFVMDAAITRLPDAMIFAGRAADLVTLAGGHQLEGEDAVRAAVARFDVSNAAEQASAGLNQSVDFTTRSSLGTNIADRLDTFMAAAAAFAPPTMLAAQLPDTDAATLAANARKVYAAALPLTHLLLAELQALLAQRGQDLATQWRNTEILALVAALVLAILLWVALSGPRRRPATGRPGDPERADGVPMSPLTDARQLIDDDLVHAGHAARPRARGHGDAF